MNLPARSVRSNGSRVRQLRLNRGLSQLELAKLAGYSARLIRKVESSSFVDIETVKNIAQALSTTDEPVAHFQLTLANLPFANNRNRVNFVGVRPCKLFSRAMSQEIRAEQAATEMHPMNR